MTAGFDGVERRGLMFVLSSPSGAGKTTLSRLLIERMPGLKMSVSATTRPMRPGEVDGRDYFFVVNQNVDDAFAEVQSILKAERLKRERRTGLTEFVRKLQRQLEK